MPGRTSGAARHDRPVRPADARTQHAGRLVAQPAIHQAVVEEGGLRRLTEVNDELLSGIELAEVVNERTDNIGARRLHTMIERVVEELSFTAPERSGETVEIDDCAAKSACGLPLGR